MHHVGVLAHFRNDSRHFCWLNHKWVTLVLDSIQVRVPFLSNLGIRWCFVKSEELVENLELVGGDSKKLGLGVKGVELMVKVAQPWPAVAQPWPEDQFSRNSSGPPPGARPDEKKGECCPGKNSSGPAYLARPDERGDFRNFFFVGSISAPHL